MDTRAIAAAAALVLVAAACGAPGEISDSDGTWVGTITTEGDVTTVVTESGSVWGGTARLVEEVSIGVEAGADEYMFGRIEGVAATNDDIYVIDVQLPRVRRYDRDGVFVGDLGGAGQGPGEYTQPALITLGSDGRVYVYDWGTRRTLVYGSDDAPLETWSHDAGFCCVWPIFVDDGLLWMLTYEVDRATRKELWGIGAFGAEGPAGPEYRLREIEVETQRLEAGDRTLQMPFSRAFTWTTAGPGRFLAGANDRYRFEVQLRGETTRVVERHWQPVPIRPEHAEWERKATIARGRRYDPGWNWDGDGMPTTHPPFGTLIAAANGETWVVRDGPSEPVADCDEDPLVDRPESAPRLPACWKRTFFLDAFDAEGRFLGSLPLPEEIRYPDSRRLKIDGDRVVAVTEGDDGVIRVKRYRLVLPNVE